MTNGKFEVIPLPDNFQSSMIQAFVYDDFDGDNQPEMLCAGNFYPYNVEQGKSDSFFGGMLDLILHFMISICNFY